VLDEIEALREELWGMEEGQVVVIFYDRLEPVLGVLREHGGIPVSAIEDVKRQPAGVKV
jgi:hypothetical protein